MGRARLRLLAPILLALGCGGCLSVAWNRTLEGRPVAAEVLASMPPAGAPLAACLEHLGAPYLVREHRVHGLVAAWVWQNDRTVGATVSLPITDSFEGSFRYTDGRARRHAVVLWFDAHWRLVDWREGWLSDLFAPPPPPASIDALAGERDG